MKSMIEVTQDGDRLEQLETLAEVLANALDGADYKSMAQIARQYRETIKEIEEIKGATNDDDEISAILSERQTDGKPGAVRKNRS